MVRKRVKSKVTLDGKLMFPSDYVSAIELGGRDVTLTISAVSLEPLQMEGGGRKDKMVLRFQGATKRMVCNKTNAESIAQLYGTKAEAWVGKRVTLYATRCLAFGDMVECIRVRETVPGGKNGQAAATAPAPPPLPEPEPEPEPAYAGTEDEQSIPFERPGTDADPFAAERASTESDLRDAIAGCRTAAALEHVRGRVDQAEELLGVLVCQQLRDAIAKQAAGLYNSAAAKGKKAPASA